MVTLLLINTIVALIFMGLYVQNREEIKDLETKIKILKIIEEMKNEK